MTPLQDGRLDQLDKERGIGRRGEQKEQRDRIGPLPGKLEGEFFWLPREELVRDLEQKSSAGAGPRIAATGPPVDQILKDHDAPAHDIMRTPAVDIRDKAETAGVMLV